MAAVYRALDEVTGAEVAFKLLHARKAADRQARTLFEREHHTLVGLKHPRIIEVFTYGLSDVGPFYTMDLLEGTDLRQLAPLGYGEACRYLRDIASSLALLHAKRLLHRDLSPRNVRLTSDGSAKLIDFGALASFGWNNEIIGTAPFIAPEALLATPLEQQADLFSLGALGQGAVRVAEALSIQSGSVSLALCLRLTDDMSESRVYRALDELVAGEVLLLGDGSYRFCHDIQRQALSRRRDLRRCAAPATGLHRAVVCGRCAATAYRSSVHARKKPAPIRRSFATQYRLGASGDDV